MVGMGKSFLVPSVRNFNSISQMASKGRTLRMCHAANVALERGQSVLVIAVPEQLDMLRLEPYFLDEKVRAISSASPEAMHYYETENVEGFDGLVFVDHMVWEVRGYRSSNGYPVFLASMEDQDDVNAPHVPPGWSTMPKGDVWLIVADYWADAGDVANEKLARLHHRLL